MEWIQPKYNYCMEVKNINIVRNLLRETGWFNDEYSDIEGITISEQEVEKDSIFFDSFNRSSKNGSGNKGYPDFFIEIPDKDLVIIIESKSNISNLYSENLNSYTDYALDGAIWYKNTMLEETKPRNILLVGTAGESKEEFTCINHFYKNNKLIYAKRIESDFLSPVNVYEIFTSTDKAKINKKIEKASKKIHDILWKAKVNASDNSLIISSILIALKDNTFRNTYKNIENEKIIAKEIISSVNRVLENKIKKDNLNSLLNRIKFLPSTQLIEKNNKSFTKIIDIVRENVYDSMVQENSDSFIDEVGHFYNEFLRYANDNDGKNLGIVLTPFYICDLATEIAKVDLHSVVLDPTAGTGGFLVAALQKMFSLNPTELEKEKIRNESLIGVEENDKIYPLLLSNMIVRNDGKSSCIKGDFFKVSKTKELKDLKPNTVLMNPPYSQGEGLEEWKFIIEALKIMQKGGILVAVVPQSILDSNKKYKKLIIENHTIMSIIILKHDLFGTQANVNTCLIVIKSKIPNDQNETVMIDFRNDGMSRKKGSLNWESKDNDWNNKKRKIVGDIYNKKENGIDSILVNLTHEQKTWNPAHYFKNNLKITFTKELVEYKTREYIQQQISEGETITVSKTNKIFDYTRISNWETHSLKNDFEVVNGSSIPEINRERGDIPYIGASMFKSGVSEYIAPVENYIPIIGKTITYGKQGQTGSGVAFFQKRNRAYIASSTVFILKPKREMTDLEMLYISMILETEKFRFNFGFKPTKDFLENLTYNLPMKNGKVLNETLKELIDSSGYDVIEKDINES